MKLTRFSVLILICSMFLSSTKGKGLEELIPAGYEIKDSTSGFLNNDEYRDLILVLKQVDEETKSKTSEFAIKRETVILYGSENGYTVVARNMNAVYCFNCGGPMGDPFVGINIKDHTFSISHYGGGVWRWGRTSTFSMNAKGTWVLTKDENETFSTENPEVTKDTVITTPKDFGVIAFENYDIDKE